MENEDSRMALFCEPNAYIQKYDYDSQKCPPSQARKVVFQEPYENLPTYYPDNNFKKGNCSCLPKQPCKHDKAKDCGQSFDIKNILPLLTGLLGNSGGGLNNILSSMNLGNGTGSFDMSNLISTVASNPNMLSSILNLFKGKGAKKKSSDFKMKSSDLCIKDYVRVE